MRTVHIFLFVLTFTFSSFGQNHLIQEMVNATNRDSLLLNVQNLQSFGTRYEFTPTQDSAAHWILRQFKQWGLQADFDDYIIGNCTFWDADLVNKDSIWIVGANNSVFFTSNGGTTWNVQNSPAPATSIFFGVDFITNTNGVAVGSSGTIIRTTNAGSSWVSVSSEIQNHLYSVSFADTSTGIIVGANGTILRSTTSGASWEIIKTQTSRILQDVKFISPSYAIAVGDSGYILKSTDKGLTWYKKPSGITSLLYAVHFIDEQIGFACGDALVLLKTIDGGETWNQLPFTNLSSGSLRGILFMDSQNGLLIDISSKHFKTTDGGQSWQIAENLIGDKWNSYFIKLKGIPNQRIVIAGNSSILFTSNNNGETWTNNLYSLPPQCVHISQNIVATIPGTVTPEQECIMVAHYDSRSNNPYVLAPGANDNATGTAAVMEAARIMRKYQFASTIKLLAVSGEEVGLRGSGHYAYTAKEQKRSIAGVINGDMLGYPLLGDTLHLTASTYLNRNRLLDSAILFNQQYQIGLNLIQSIDYSGGSDHLPFSQAGYDALIFIEAFASEIWAGADPFYHTESDSASKLNFGLVRRAAQLMLATVAGIADATGRATSINELVKETPLSPELYQNYPNPFNSSTTISFFLPFKSTVSLKITDLYGRAVKTLISKDFPPGKHYYQWNPLHLKTGIYYYHLQAGSHILTRKLILL